MPAPTAAHPRTAVAALRSRADILAVIALGGALGSLGRWGLGRLVPWRGHGFPWATFVENLSGALALGALMVLVLDVWPPRRYLRPFLGVGLLGGYTTFSTYMLETRSLFAAGQLPLALGYVAGSLLGGLVAVWAGMAAVRLAVRRSRRRRTHRHPDGRTLPDNDRSPR